MLSPSRGKRSALHQVSSLTLRLVLLLAPLLVLLAPGEAQAYHWMIKHGYPTCGGCHTDPSGGELLTFYGRTLSEAVLSTPWGGSGEGATAMRPLPRPRLARSPSSFAARPKLADKDGVAEEKIELEEDAAPEGDKPAADAESTEASAAEAAPAPAAEEEGDGSGSIAPFLFGLWEPPDWLLLGGSYRHMNIITPQSAEKFRTFPMMMDVYGQAQFGSFKVGGSLGAARVPTGSPYARPAQITANQGDQWNLISRTHYIGYDITTDLQVRAGRLNLPFGVRIPEHTMWARMATRTDRESSQQHGVSVTYNHESFRFELMGIAGNYQINPDRYRERGYAGYFEYYVTPKTVLGVSSLVTVAGEDRVVQDKASMTRMAHGGILRNVVNESFMFVLEANALVRSRYDVGYVGFAQADFEATQGLHFMLTGELLDEGHSRALDAPARLPGAGKPKVGGWLSACWWFLPHFDVRIDGIQRTGEDLSILAQLHAYL